MHSRPQHLHYGEAGVRWLGNDSLSYLNKNKGAQVRSLETCWKKCAILSHILPEADRSDPPPPHVTHSRIVSPDLTNTGLSVFGCSHMLKSWLSPTSVVHSIPAPTALPFTSLAGTLAFGSILQKSLFTLFLSGSRGECWVLFHLHMGKGRVYPWLSH